MIKNQQILFSNFLMNSQNGLKCNFWFIVDMDRFLNVGWALGPNLACFSKD